MGLNLINSPIKIKIGVVDVIGHQLEPYKKITFRNPSDSAYNGDASREVIIYSNSVQAKCPTDP